MEQLEKLAITLATKLAGRSSATAKAVPAIMQTGGPEGPGRSRGLVGLLVTGNPVVGNPIAVAPNRVLNQARVARGG